MGRAVVTLWVLAGLWAMHGLAMPGSADPGSSAAHGMVMATPGSPTTEPMIGCYMSGHDMCVATLRAEPQLGAPAAVAVLDPVAVLRSRPVAALVTATPRAPPDATDLDRLCICRT